MSVYADHDDLPFIDMIPVDNFELLVFKCRTCGELFDEHPEEPEPSCPEHGGPLSTVGRTFQGC